jgi:phage shock protein A
MVDQYLIDMKEALAEVKRETAGVMALEKSCKRDYDENTTEIERFKSLAKKAADAGNDEDSKTFIGKYLALEANSAALKSNLDVATANADKMREMHNKLVSDIQTLEGRKAQIKATVSIAKATSKVSEFGNSASNAANIGNKFSDMEDKANRMLDQAAAQAELNMPMKDQAESLADKYTGASATDIEAELAKLKQQ